MSRVSEFFYKESKSKKNLRGWGMAWVSDFFYKESKPKKKKISVLSGGCVFVLQRIKSNFLGGGGRERLVIARR